MSPDAHTPAQRADAVLRAAEAAAAAAQAAADAVHAASLPAPAEVQPPAQAEPGAEPEQAPGPPIHEAGSAARLLAAAGDLEAHVAQARAQLDALEDALERLERYDTTAD